MLRVLSRAEPCCAVPWLLAQAFMGEVQSASTRLHQTSGSVEEYVEKIQFLAEVRAKEKSLDGRCNEIHDLYALIDQ